MQRGTIATRSKRKRQVRFPGLVNAADTLGVHRNHLYLVLSGKRISHRLKLRYEQHLAKEAEKKAKAEKS